MTEQVVRARLVFAYDGTEFSGWATQPGLRTVQGRRSRPRSPGSPGSRRRAHHRCRPHRRGGARARRRLATSTCRSRRGSACLGRANAIAGGGAAVAGQRGAAAGHPRSRASTRRPSGSTRGSARSSAAMSYRVYGHRAPDPATRRFVLAVRPPARCRRPQRGVGHAHGTAGLCRVLPRARGRDHHPHAHRTVVGRATERTCWRRRCAPTRSATRWCARSLARCSRWATGGAISTGSPGSPASQIRSQAITVAPAAWASRSRRWSTRPTPRSRRAPNSPGRVASRPTSTAALAGALAGRCRRGPKRAGVYRSGPFVELRSDRRRTARGSGADCLVYERGRLWPSPDCGDEAAAERKDCR